jgi:hypothetical protein
MTQTDTCKNTSAPLAQIITERLSDGSLAYNVRVEGGITFGCTNERAAVELQHVIINCTAWVETDGGGL